MLLSFQIHIPTKPLHAQCTECGNEQEVTWEEIPDFGELITMDHFMKMIDLRVIMNHDGYGNLASKDKMSCLEISPSLIKKDPIYKHHDVTALYTHIVWFNK